TLAQKPEYRKMVGTIAEEMTRKWVKLKTVGDDDKAERVRQLYAAMEKFRVKEKFREAAEHDGYFGGGQIYIDVKTAKGASAWTDAVELQSKLFISDKKIPYDALNGAYAGYTYGYPDSFPGYPYLATLAQKPEYRKMVGTIAEEMTRKWVKLKTVGDD
ncbi:anti-CBASS protein Acb1 family protein, partial [Cronobacter malonaticus]|uniref:anti-CBASS protein Acb1 family protein n=1 Tax=Cronobacter malonaticus TaxID=413503 RepID=UPI001F1C9390